MENNRSKLLLVAVIIITVITISAVFVAVEKYTFWYKAKSYKENIENNMVVFKQPDLQKYVKKAFGDTPRIKIPNDLYNKVYWEAIKAESDNAIRENGLKDGQIVYVSGDISSVERATLDIDYSIFDLIVENADDNVYLVYTSDKRIKKGKEWVHKQIAESKVSEVSIGALPLDTMLLGNNIEKGRNICVKLYDNDMRFVKNIAKKTITCIGRYKDGKLTTIADEHPFFYEYGENVPSQELLEGLVHGMDDDLEAPRNKAIIAVPLFFIALFVWFFFRERVREVPQPRNVSGFGKEIVTYNILRLVFLLILIAAPFCVIALLTSIYSVTAHISDSIGFSYFMSFPTSATFPFFNTVSLTFLTSVALIIMSEKILRYYYEEKILYCITQEKRELITRNYDMDLDEETFETLGITLPFVDDEEYTSQGKSRYRYKCKVCYNVNNDPATIWGGKDNSMDFFLYNVTLGFETHFISLCAEIPLNIDENIRLNIEPKEYNGYSYLDTCKDIHWKNFPEGMKLLTNDVEQCEQLFSSTPFLGNVSMINSLFNNRLDEYEVIFAVHAAKLYVFAITDTNYLEASILNPITQRHIRRDANLVDVMSEIARSYRGVSLISNAS